MRNRTYFLGGGVFEEILVGALIGVFKDVLECILMSVY